MKHGQIKIKLRSALVAGSGYAYAGTIDRDLCYDKYGFPYIPARRLKGCLKDIAENQISAIIENEIDDIFGKRGENKVCGISLMNAHLEGRRDVIDDIRIIQKSKRYKQIKELLKSQRILEQFTGIKSQTAMDEGVADDNSLRQTRIVHSVLPYSHERTCFVADALYDEKIEKDFENTVKGLRNIGLMRTRGMGSVTCEFNKDAENTYQDSYDEFSATDLNGDMCEITYKMMNVEPLMISEAGDNVSLRYIPGRNVLGLMASRYLSDDLRTADDEAFKELFLGKYRDKAKKVVFTNAYPCKGDRTYYPAPSFINKMKKSKELVNIQAEDDQSPSDDKGNIPKKLKGKFISLKDDKVDEYDVDMRMIYHHSKGNDTEGLYTHQAISEEQVFTGRIIAPKEHAKLLISLLKDYGDLYFGKSKTSQYGQCVLLDENKPADYKKEPLNVENGTELLITFVSDGVFLNERGYTVDYDDVVKSISKALEELEIEVYSSDDVDSLGMNAFSIIQTKKIYGYNTKWNMRKQPIPAIEAGSVFAVKVKKGGPVQKELFVGEKNSEGYGQVMIITTDHFERVLSPPDDDGTDDEEAVELQNELVKQLISQIAVDEICAEAKNRIIGGSDFSSKPSMDIPSALRGRITLMLTESIDKYPDDDQWEDRLKDFMKRIDSIKDNHKCETIKQAFKEKILTENCKSVDMQKLYKGNEKMIEEVFKNGLEYNDERVKSLIAPAWSDVLMTMLVNDKYMDK